MPALTPRTHDGASKIPHWKCGMPVGATGFEPMTSPTRTVRATGLRHAPNGPSVATNNVKGKCRL